jgi:hypothetical protein
LDYPAAEQRDWRWRRKEEMVLDAIEDDLITEMNRLSHHWHCSAAQVTGWDEKEELFNYHKRQASYAYNVIGRATLPWYKKWRTDEVSIAELWKKFKESEKDPKYAAHLDGLRKKLKEKNEEYERSVRFSEELVENVKKRNKELQELVGQKQDRMRKRKLAYGEGTRS